MEAEGGLVVDRWGRMKSRKLEGCQVVDRGGRMKSGKLAWKEAGSGWWQEGGSRAAQRRGDGEDECFGRPPTGSASWVPTSATYRLAKGRRDRTRRFVLPYDALLLRRQAGAESSGARRTG